MTGMIEFGMSDGTVQVVLNPQLQSQIPATALDQIKRAEVSIKRGAIKPLAKPSALS
jgi:hypothetical protein